MARLLSFPNSTPVVYINIKVVCHKVKIESPLKTEDHDNMVGNDSLLALIVKNLPANAGD